MRSTLTLIGASLLLASSLSAVPCAPSPTTLCLNGSRFEVEVSWRDSRGRTGVGQAVSITADTGYFWFFSQTNIELVVKVLDARSINQKYWVFFGALSSVEYDLTVTDTATGAVKTYHNPLGQFASVGDTSAFDPGPGIRATTETVDVAGTLAPPESMAAIQGLIDENVSKETAAFAPCTDGGGALYLADCRFRLDVHWADARGRHGAGRPVQLTSDTGYFWFFSDSNVELMVKVLDARGVNGNFWVFFGALSNVEYTINVTDTVSGAIRSYRNPASSFASVGDTGAFRGGHGVDVHTDSTLAASSSISAAEGGSLSVTSADGAVFTLVIPPDSLYDDETITMTPVASVGRLPFAGGLAAGVEIQPAGVPLLQGATLSIHTPAPIARSEETPVAWNGAGEDFYLAPPWPTSGDLRLEIFHLGGYGVVRGTEGERQAQLAQEPVADGDLLSHELAPLLREGRAAAALNGESDPKRTAVTIVQRLDAGYEALKIKMAIANRDPAVVVSLIEETKQWIGQVLVATGETIDTIFPGRRNEIHLIWKDMISQALETIHQRCSEDPVSVLEIGPLVRASKLSLPSSLFSELQAEVDNVLKCLTFKLRFDSTLVFGGGGITTTHRVLAEQVPLRAKMLDDGRVRAEGEGPIGYMTSLYAGLPSGCTQTSQLPGTSTFRGRVFWTRSGIVVLEYHPGTPTSLLTARCEGASITSQEWSVVYKTFRVRHNDPVGRDSYQYQTAPVVKGGKDPWAMKIVSNLDQEPAGPFSEYSVFFLAHTPE